MPDENAMPVDDRVIGAEPVTIKKACDIADQRAPLLDEGAFLHLTNAAGLPLYDDEGKPVGVVLRGRNSRVGLLTWRAVGNRRLETARKMAGTYTTTVESNEAESIDMLSTLTVSWTFSVYAGQPFPCTPENARKFWSDDKNIRWRREGEDFIASEANFTRA